MYCPPMEFTDDDAPIVHDRLAEGKFSSKEDFDEAFSWTVAQGDKTRVCNRAGIQIAIEALSKYKKDKDYGSAKEFYESRATGTVLLPVALFDSLSRSL